MTSAATPADEGERLRVLRELRLTEARHLDAALDALAKLAAQLCDSPMAALSFVESDHQWFAASVGLRTGRIPRELSFCAHALGQPGAHHLQVHDAHADPRFVASPLVHASPHARCYAGVPIRLDGHAVGTVCVMDTRPRSFDAAQLHALSEIAVAAEAVLQGRLREQRARLREARVRAASRASSDWLWETDAAGLITWVSDGFEAHTGLPPSHDIGRAANDVNRPRGGDEHAASWEQLVHAYRQRESFTNALADRDTMRGTRVVSISGVPVFDTAGAFRGYRGAARDVTDELAVRDQARRSELLRHAVLQSVPDLWFVIDAQGRYAECGDARHPLLIRPFEEIRGRRIAEVVPPDLARQCELAIERAHASGEVQRIEYELLVVDGRMRSFEARIAPMPQGQTLYITRDFTELRSLERDVRLMQRALEAEAAMPMVVCDAAHPDLPLIYVNPAFERLTGYTRDELLGRNCRFLQGAATEQEGLATLREALARGGHCTVTLRNQRRDGSWFTNEVHVAPVRDGSGRLTHYIGVMHDVSERARDAEKLAVSEALYRSVATAVTDGLLVVGHRGVILTANPAAIEVLGEASVGGQRLSEIGFELLHEDGRPVPPGEHPVRLVMERQAPVNDQVYALRRPDGSVVFLRVSVQPLQVECAGDPYSCVVTFRDITAQRAAQRALHEAQQRWEFALDGAGEGVWDRDEDTRSVFYSRRWKEILGYEEHEIGGSQHEWLDRIHSDDLARVKEAMRRYRLGETESYLSEHRLRHRDGHWVWVLDRGKIVERHPDGRPRRIVGTHTDITRNKLAEGALREKQAAELASRAKSEFLSRMSHEMRTPLNAVIGFTQLMQMQHDVSLTPRLRHYTDHVLQASEHLLALVNDVLDLQQVEEGRLTLRLAPLPLREHVSAALDFVSPLALPHRISLNNSVSADVSVLADSQRLRQVLLNLASNAIKYNVEHGSVHARLDGRTREGFARLVIEDTGAGLTAQQLQRLFQPFERLGLETSKVEGTGLGLIISRRLSEEMGGSLELRSTPGRGTQVILELPLARHLGAAPAAPSVRSASAATAGRKLRMLYVEDNRINAILFEEALKLREQIELRVATDGEDALSLVHHWTPDVLVLDAHLPGMDGFELLDALRARPELARTTAFMCSADAHPDDVRAAADAGFAGYWTKPIDIVRVMHDLDTLLAVEPNP
ncbi:MAG TPA: PAS domain S-box protein [Burkholderiaceae bacterium]|nr:PAS domain S-box protein [Burkholderiaceae bacterium]